MISKQFLPVWFTILDACSVHLLTRRRQQDAADAVMLIIVLTAHTIPNATADQSDAPLGWAKYGQSMVPLETGGITRYFPDRRVLARGKIRAG